MSTPITTAQLDAISAEVAQYESAVTAAREAVQNAQAGADAAAIDDGALTPEQFCDQQDRANRLLNICKVSLTRAEAALTKAKAEHVTSLATICEKVRVVVLDLAAERRAQVRDQVLAILGNPDVVPYPVNEAIDIIMRSADGIHDRETAAGFLHPFHQVDASRNRSLSMILDRLRAAMPFLKPNPTRA